MTRVLYPIFTLLLTVTTLNLNAQLFIKGGVNFSNWISEDKTFDFDNYKTGANAGLYYKLNILDLFTIQPEIIFSQKGIKTPIRTATNDLTATYSINYIETPLLLDFRLIGPIHANAGLYLSYLLTANSRFDSAVDGDMTIYTLNKKYLKDLNYGFCIGTSITGRSIELGARYTQDVGEVNEDIDNINKDNFYLDFKNSIISIYLGIRLFK